MATASLTAAADDVVRQDLRAKFEWLLRIRREAATGRRLARAEAQELAARYPGALRELDDSPLELLEARARELEQDEALPRWARPTWLYHAALRQALEATRDGRRPPGGLVDHALAVVADETTLSVGEVRALVMPAARRRSRS